MELFIDNKKADTAPDSEITLSLTMGSITDPSLSRTGFTRTLRLPATPTNDAIFRHAADPHGRDRFNATSHIGRVEHEGCILIEGPLTLSRAERSPECASERTLKKMPISALTSTFSDIYDFDETQGFYEIHIIGAAKSWVAGAMSRSLSSLPIPAANTPAHTENTPAPTATSAASASNSSVVNTPESAAPLWSATLDAKTISSSWTSGLPNSPEILNNSETPETPEAPEAEVSETSETPEAEVSETPEIPETSEAEAPEIAEAKTPESEAPEAPEAETPEAEASETPKTAPTPVRFLPVSRRPIRRDHSSGRALPATKVLTSDDYHPFIHVATLLRAIFAAEGYRVESSLIEGSQSANPLNENSLTNSPKAETLLSENSRIESSQSENPQSENLQPNDPKAETLLIEGSQVESTQSETPQSENQPANNQQLKTPRVETPQLQPPHPNHQIFKELYLSGRYPTRDTSLARDEMDFLARRGTPTSATANSLGRVYADPYRIANTLGNIVTAPYTPENNPPTNPQNNPENPTTNPPNSPANPTPTPPTPPPP
ncbi:MAG: hypothetical protein LBV38_01980, partial [Alistipes sp.]|nr:hypothetical protein [Alistipes sp.]